MFAYEKIKKEIIANKDLAFAAREIKQALKVMQPYKVIASKIKLW